MKILILHRFLEIYGGAENVINRFCRVLEARKISYKVIALNVPSSDEETKKIYGDMVLEIPKGKKFPSVYRSAGFVDALGIFSEIIALRKLIRQNINDYDIINVHNFPATWALAGLTKGKPVVWMCNETPDFYSNPRPSLGIKFLRAPGIFLDRLIINSVVDHIVVADKINAAKVKRVYGRDSDIISYGIDTDIFTTSVKQYKKQTRSAWNIADDDFVLLQTGVVSPQKNQMESVKALLGLKESKIKSKLILAGKSDTPYRQRALDPFISKNKLSSDIIFTGHIDKHALALLYGAVDLCLFPVKEQGGWLSPFEALGCGAPVVVSSTMGAADLLKEHDFCTVTDDIESTVLQIHQSYKDYEKKSASASEWIKNNLTWEKFTDRFLEIFSKKLKFSNDKRRENHNEKK